MNRASTAVPAVDERAELLGMANALVAELEADDMEAANRTIMQIGQLRENSLFQEIGKLTREMHESLNSFANDETLSQLMQESLPDAKKRLDYVVQLTEEATHKTLNAVETCLPISSEIGEGAQHLRAQGEREKADSEKLDAWLQKTQEQSETLNRCLNDILMAQTFQDVTGQVIQRVIKLVKDVEDSLVGMIRTCGHIDEARATKPKAATVKQEASDARGHGPAIPGGAGDTVSSQDEVDDLLSTLGF